MTDITVKIGSARGVDTGHDANCKIKLGTDNKTSRVAKKGGNYSWDETFQFKMESDKTLTITLIQHKLLKKSEIGSVTIDINTLKDEVLGQYYKLTKKSRDCGEIQLTIQSPSLKPNKKGALSLKELEKLEANEFIQPEITSPISPRDPFDMVSQLKTGLAFASAATILMDGLKLQSTTLELGTIRFTWQKEGDDSSPLLDLWVPRRLTTAETATSVFVQHPFLRMSIKNTTLQLRPCYKIDSTIVTEERNGSTVYIGRVEARAISEANKNVANIKFVFQVDKAAIEKIVNDDELYESVPDYDPNELMEACKKGLLDKVIVCLDRWDDVNYSNEAKETPLHRAVTNGDENLIRALIERGADPRIVDNYGSTPVDIAEKFFKKNLIPLLRTYQ
eukprot:TRINITY_DN10543_c0_g1_i1.p1 TRINITY_DN10543_c0_g1~~TRINITY_DN10543_c0_g1_i1.p1  ORF type:complete len:392 (-),score=64.43 TRINITY_DN10543_c0_g1_i1:48-1223(-)